MAADHPTSSASLALVLAAILGPMAHSQTTELQWQDFRGHRMAPLQVAAPARTGFTELDSTITGIQFTNLLSDDRSLTNQIYLNGSGVAAGDVNGDGLSDLYFCGLDTPNALYLNRGQWRFDEVAASAGVACADQASTGTALADIDGDGDLDLLVNGIFRGARLFLNDGQARFREVTEEAGWRSTLGGVTFAIADVEGDGDLDVYSVNYQNDTMRDMPDIQFSVFVTNRTYQLRSVNGRPATEPDLIGRFTFDPSGGVLENGQPDALYRNAGAARFQRVDWTDGTFVDEQGRPLTIPYEWGLSAIFRDFNQDAAPDLYVCNDFQSPDHFWINSGKGTFRPISTEALRHTSLFSMAADSADIDRDGHVDFFVADMLSPDHARRQVQVMESMAFSQLRQTDADRPQILHNMLFHHRGNGTYAEIARYAGIDSSDWTWSPVFLDVDLDGYEDLLVATGHWRDAQHRDAAQEIEVLSRQKNLSTRQKLHLRQKFPRLETPNYLFRNQGNLTFIETGAAWGFHSTRVSQGMALADLDNDGDLDVVINCLNASPVICRNDATQPRLAVRLRGRPPNTHGIGATIRVRTTALPNQSQEMIAGGRYLSSDDPIRTFAAGNHTNLLEVEVRWRSGNVSTLAGLPANHLVEIQEASANTSLANPPPPFTPGTSTNTWVWFKDVSSLLMHRHQDAWFDDFSRQTLLPHKLSTFGPGVTWFDFNGDGWDDLLIGAGREGRLAAFRNDGRGGFIPQKASVLSQPADRDLTAILGWQPGATSLSLIIGLDSYETDATNAPAFRSIALQSGSIDDVRLPSHACTGPLALGDIDRDGDLDLFLGGRVVPSRYPEAATFCLVLNTNGHITSDLFAADVLANVGLVNSALFTDLDGDGWPELIVACDWGPIRVYQSLERGLKVWNLPLRWTAEKLPQNPPNTLDQLDGWWTSLTAGDFDNDGRMDLVAGNFGRNTSRRRYAHQPLRLYYGQVPGSSGLGLLEAEYDRGMNAYAPTRDLATILTTFPHLKQTFPTFAAFSTATISDILRADLPPMRFVSATLLDSILLLNRGDHLEVRSLPYQAQVAPIFGIATGDLDGDGNADLALSQNFFGVFPADSRYDAGCGAWLRGSGRGTFVFVPPSESGISILGEGRGLALGDFDHDGKLDLAATQHRGETKLYHNQRAPAGLRIRLHGAQENPRAVGASVRLCYRSGRFGPRHEIRLGGGWYSQDTTDLVLGFAEEAEALDIRWPGGATERVALQPGDRFLERRHPSVPQH